MPNDYSTDRHWIGELILNMPEGRKSYGKFNRDEIKMGSEGGTVDDPEDGVGIPTGGKQTAENLSISRPYKRSRDRIVYIELKPLRGRVTGEFLVWEADDDGNPYSETPLDTLDIRVQQITIPKGAAGSSDSGEISLDLQVRP